jgi:hypothetical protein
MENQKPVITDESSKDSNPLGTLILYVVFFLVGYYLLSAFTEWEAKRIYEKRVNYIQGR